MRLVTFNIRNGRAWDRLNSWPFRRKRCAATIRSFDADIIALQEAFGFQQHYIDVRMPGYDLISRPRGRCIGERLPLFVRARRFSVEYSWTRWFSEDPDEPRTMLPGASFPRIATAAVLTDRANGLRFGVANVHLDELHPVNRERSLELLTDWIDDGLPWVVLGDFNAESDDQELRVLSDAGFRSALPPNSGGTTHDFDRGSDGRQIDHIFLRGPFDVDNARIAVESSARPASDHWPVVVELGVAGGGHGRVV